MEMSKNVSQKPLDKSELEQISPLKEQVENLATLKAVLILNQLGIDVVPNQDLKKSFIHFNSKGYSLKLCPITQADSSIHISKKYEGLIPLKVSKNRLTLFNPEKHQPVEDPKQMMHYDKESNTLLGHEDVPVNDLEIDEEAVKAMGGSEKLAGLQAQLLNNKQFQELHSAFLKYALGVYNPDKGKEQKQDFSRVAAVIHRDINPIRESAFATVEKRDDKKLEEQFDIRRGATLMGRISERSKEKAEEEEIKKKAHDKEIRYEDKLQDEERVNKSDIQREHIKDKQRKRTV